MTRLASLAALIAIAGLPVSAQDSEEGRGADQGAASQRLGASTDTFLPEGGSEIYAIACSGCHQPQGQGAIGAAAYPPLAANPRLQGGRYPAWIVLNGMGGMPSFGDWLDDEQVLEVVSYIQSNLGNQFETNLTVEDVAGLRDARAP